jgi:hypothetical protein
MICINYIYLQRLRKPPKIPSLDTRFRYPIWKQDLRSAKLIEVIPYAVAASINEFKQFRT